MALKGLKKADQSSNQDQIEDFIKGASKRVKKIEPSHQTYKRYTFSLTEDSFSSKLIVIVVFNLPLT